MKGDIPIYMEMFSQPPLMNQSLHLAPVPPIYSAQQTTIQKPVYMDMFPRPPPLVDQTVHIAMHLALPPSLMDQNLHLAQVTPSYSV